MSVVRLTNAILLEREGGGERERVTDRQTWGGGGGADREGGREGERLEEEGGVQSLSQGLHKDGSL